MKRVDRIITNLMGRDYNVDPWASLTVAEAIALSAAWRVFLELSDEEREKRFGEASTVGMNKLNTDV